MAEVKTILVTSKDVDGPYRINEEDFDETLHRHVSAAKEAAVEKAAEASVAKTEKADAKK
jgi:hypothetical protein